MNSSPFRKQALILFYVWTCLFSALLGDDFCAWDEHMEKCFPPKQNITESLSESDNAYARMWRCQFLDLEEDCTQAEECSWDSLRKSCGAQPPYLVSQLQDCIFPDRTSCLRCLHETLGKLSSPQKLKGMCTVVDMIEINFEDNLPCCDLSDIAQDRMDNRFCSAIFNTLRCYEPSKSKYCQKTCQLYSDEQCFKTCEGKVSTVDELIAKVFQPPKKWFTNEKEFFWHPLSHGQLSTDLFPLPRQYMDRSSLVSMIKCFEWASKESCLEYDPTFLTPYYRYPDEYDYGQFDFEPFEQYSIEKVSTRSKIFQGWVIYGLIFLTVLLFIISGSCCALQLLTTVWSRRTQGRNQLSQDTNSNNVPQNRTRRTELTSIGVGVYGANSRHRLIETHIQQLKTQRYMQDSSLQFQEQQVQDIPNLDNKDEDNSQEVKFQNENQALNSTQDDQIGDLQKSDLKQSIVDLSCVKNEQNEGENSNQQSNNQDECVICQVPYVSNQMIVVLPCNHYFHEDCIKKWVRTRGVNVTCPLCVKRIFQDVHDEQGEQV